MLVPSLEQLVAWSIETVEILVEDRHVGEIAILQNEGRAAHSSRVVEAIRDSLHQSSLACSEHAFQSDPGGRHEQSRELTAKLDRLFFRARLDDAVLQLQG